MLLNFVLVHVDVVVFHLEKSSIFAISDKSEVLSLVLDLTAVSPDQLGVLLSGNRETSSEVVNNLGVVLVVPDLLASIIRVENNNLGLLVLVIGDGTTNSEVVLHEKPDRPSLIIKGPQLLVVLVISGELDVLSLRVPLDSVVWSNEWNNSKLKSGSDWVDFVWLSVFVLGRLDPEPDSWMASKLFPVLNTEWSGLVISLLSSSVFLHKIGIEGWGGSSSFSLIILKVLIWSSSEIERFSVEISNEVTLSLLFFNGRYHCGSCSQ